MLAWWRRVAPAVVSASMRPRRGSAVCGKMRASACVLLMDIAEVSGRRAGLPQLRSHVAVAHCFSSGLGAPEPPSSPLAHKGRWHGSASHSVCFGPSLGTSKFTFRWTTRITDAVVGSTAGALFAYAPCGLAADMPVYASASAALSFVGGGRWSGLPRIACCRLAYPRRTGCVVKSG